MRNSQAGFCSRDDWSLGFLLDEVWAEDWLDRMDFGGNPALPNSFGFGTSGRGLATNPPWYF